MNKRLFTMATLLLASSLSYAQPTTWAVDFSDANIKRWPTNIESLTTKTKWEYSNGIILHGIEKVYEHTKNANYLVYIKKWVDSYVADNGTVTFDTSAHSLDQIQPGVLCLFLYKETGNQKYKAGADYILSYLSKQPKNTSGGFWHKATYPNQMWTDGIYMAEPFVSSYGYRLGKMDFCDSTATFQPNLLYTHAYTTTSKLLFHAWDETKKAAWADAATGLSPCVWSRGMGWYSAGMVDILKYLPKNHPQYGTMMTMLGNIAEGIKNSQDASTGLWFQVTDKPSLAGNFIESSGSGLFIYAIKTAVDYGFIDKSYLAVAQKGWTGFKNKITLDTQGLPVINGFVGATSVGALSDYLAATLVSCPSSTAPHGYCAALYAASAMELQTVPKYRLSVNVAGQGSVTNPTGEMFQDSGSTVTLTAVPASGYRLSQWSGDASGNALTAAITMNAEKSVTATFSQGNAVINGSVIGTREGAYFATSRKAVMVTVSLSKPQIVSLGLFDCQGRNVLTITRFLPEAGIRRLEIPRGNLAAGRYFARVSIEKQTYTARLLLAE